MTDVQYEPDVVEPTFTFPEWRPLPGYELAACKDMDVDAFYPVGNTSVRGVKMVCYWCPLGRNGGQEGPLVDSCVRYEMDMDPTSHSEGIWGGSTPRERERILAGEIAPADLYTACAGCGDPCPVSVLTTFCSTECKNQHKDTEKATRECTACGVTKPAADFPPRTDRGSRRHSKCRPCQKEYKANWDAARKGKEDAA